MPQRTSTKQVRGARFVEKVFTSTAAEVVRVGHQKVSIEEVAARAGVNKTSIYRRWATPDQLVLQMFERGSAERKNSPDTGTLRGDLVAYVMTYEELRRTPSALAILRMYVTDSFTGELGRLLRRLAERDRQHVITMFERAIERGEIPRGASPQMGSDLLHGITLELMVVRPTRRARTGPAKTVERLVEAIIFGLTNVALHDAASGGERGR